MLLVPRSRRGTWLLAGVVWLGACAGAWWLLPVEPRYKWTAPQICRLVGVLADGTLATQDFSESESSYSGPVRLWNAENGTELLPQPLWRNDHVVSATLSPDGEVIIAHLNRTTPDRERIDVRYHFRSMQCEIPVMSVTNAESAIVGWTPALSPDGNTLAIYRALFGPESPKRVVREWIEIWECEPPRLRSRFEGASAPMSFSPDGRFLATGPPHISGDPEPIKSAVVWDVATGKKLFEFRRSAERMQAAKFDSTGCTIAVTWAPKNRRRGSNTTSVLEWQTGAEEVTFDNTWLVEFLPGGESLIVLQFTGNGHWSINRWDRATESFRYHGYDLWHPVSKVSMQLSPDARVVATPIGTGTKSIHPTLRPILDRLGLGRWADIPWSEELLLLNSENGRILGRIPDTSEVVFAPDSRSAYSVYNREIRVWDIPPRKSAAWFALSAALLALPIALIARWRVRRLKAA